MHEAELETQLALWVIFTQHRGRAMQQHAEALLAMHDNIMNRWRACIVCRRGLCQRREASDRFNYNREWDKWDFKWRSKGGADSGGKLSSELEPDRDQQRRNQDEPCARSVQGRDMA